MAYTTINKGSSFMNTVLYTGNSSYGHGITGVGFQPDLVWIKKRNASADHQLTDAVRGTDKTLESNTTDVERTGVNLLHSFDADGFTVDDDGSFNSANPFVSWSWKAGTTSGIAGSPSITPTSYSFNQTSGVSIIKYVGNGTSGATIPHGLGVKPSMIIVKGINYAEQWEVYHKSLGATKTIKLDSNAAASSSTGRWNDTEPTTTLFSVGNADATNKNTYNYIAYCFADVDGFSKMGSYTGNGNADGVFTFTGFKPSFIMSKRTDGANQWIMLNNKMSLYNNNTGDEIFGDLSNAQNSFTDGGADFLSNGFKLRGTNASLNLSGGEYIYIAFGQSIVGTNNVPATAR